MHSENWKFYIAQSVRIFLSSSIAHQELEYEIVSITPVQIYM